MTIILARVSGRPSGIVVDRAIKEQDIIVKPLNVDADEGGTHFSAVTILGDGNPVLIIDIDSLVEYA